MTAWVTAENSQTSGRLIPPAKRMPSGRWIDSILITSAPSAPSTLVATGPAQNAEKSATFTPSSGSFRLWPFFGERSRRPRGSGWRFARRESVCSPRRGARSKGRQGLALRLGRRTGDHGGQRAERQDRRELWSL